MVRQGFDTDRLPSAGTPDDADDSSGYILDTSRDEMIDFNDLFSSQFSNISVIYESVNGATRLYTATRFGKKFVLKGLKEQFRSDPIRNLALAKEFEIGISLDHPNIRRTLSLEDIDGIGRVIVLEYVDGNPLSQLIRDRSLSSDSARFIAAQFTDALAYIHSKQVFHRDLKPDNIIVSFTGNVVKIIDFNYSDSTGFVVLKNPAGTLKYVAPEIRESGVPATAASDIFSLGVILDEMSAVTSDHILADIAGKCMQPSPSRRPRSAALIRIPGSDNALSRFLSSTLLTVIMLCICIALAAAIGIRLLPSLT
ncbi:MAG: protein kinase [Muribaculaceae bacterium]|nr:protein kinase [Muribaculaceae bacterium]